MNFKIICFNSRCNNKITPITQIQKNKEKWLRPRNLVKMQTIQI